MAASYAVLGFRNPDGSNGFGLTTSPLRYIDNVSTGEYESRRIKPYATLLWAVAAESHNQAIELRRRWNATPSSQLAREAARSSVPQEILQELLGLSKGATELSGPQLRARETGALRLIHEHGGNVRVFVPALTQEPDSELASTCPFIKLPAPVEASPKPSVGGVRLDLELAIFDLDGTLVDSSILRDARDAGDWPQVRRRLAEISAMPSWDGCAPHQVPSLLHDMDIGVALVSRAPRWYVDQLVKRMDIYSDWTVAACGKDKVTAFDQVRKRFGAVAEQTVVFGDDKSDFKACASLGILSLGNPWASRTPPDVAPDIAWLDVGTLLEGGEWHQRLRYIGESVGNDVKWHRGSLLPFGTDAYALGRYYTKLRNLDWHREHPLSLGIVASKKSTEADPHIFRAFSAAVERLATRVQIDAVLSVPPRAGQSDRFVPYRQAVVDLTGADDLAVRQRGMGLGKYEISRRLDGQTVLLIDDVVTKGSTMFALKNTAERAGATRVIQLVFGVTQNLDD